MRKISSPREILTLDLRALAVFRVGIGLLLALDTLMRWRDLRAHYADFGILPVAPFIQQFGNRLHISLHLASGTAGWQHCLFAITLLAGLAMMLGWRTRLATIAGWVLLVSVQNRNPMILNGGDVLLRLLYFWAMFLPLGARYSIDAALQTTQGAANNRLCSGGTIALILQIAMIYLSTSLLKTGKEWWPDGTASYFALSLDSFATSTGVWLRQYFTLLHAATYFVYLLEAATTFLILSPFFQVVTRTVTLAVLVLMHLNFDVTMQIGLFPWIDIVALIALLPPAVVDRIVLSLKTEARLRLTIYYDGDCGFCRRVVSLLREFLLVPETRLAPAQVDPAKAALMARENSWIVEDWTGTLHIRWDAFVTVLQHVPVAGPLARRLPLGSLAFVMDPFYRLVARHRATLGRWTAALLKERPQPEPKASALMNLLALFFIGYVGLWNLSTIPAARIRILAPWDQIGPVLRLDQKWNMFAPYPLKEDGWFVIDGELGDGTKVDVLHGRMQPASYARPASMLSTYIDIRWRKFLMNIYPRSKQAYRLYYGKYLCRSWNEGALPEGRRLAHFEIVFMKEPSVLPGETSQIVRESLWQHDCFKRANK